MSSQRSREVILLCSQSMTKMQSVSDYLLLSNDLRPIRPGGMNVSIANYSTIKESVLTRVQGLLVLTGKIRELLENYGQMEDAGEYIPDLCELTIGLIECCTHITYSVVSSLPHCTPAQEGCVDAYTIHKASLEIELTCDKLKSSPWPQMNERFLIEICTDINNNLLILRDCCKHASDNTHEECIGEQFKLCIKSFSTCGSSLLNCIKAFRQNPNPSLHSRCVHFCEPLVSAVKAAKYFSSEEQFLGNPASLSQTGKEIKLELLGACLSVSSANIHMCRCIKNLVLNSRSLMHREDLKQCTAAISKASAFLDQVLCKYSVPGVERSTDPSRSHPRHPSVSPHQANQPSEQVQIYL